MRSVSTSGRRPAPIPTLFTGLFLAAAFSGCAFPAKMDRIGSLSPDPRKPIVFGSIEGLPPGYVLRADFTCTDSAGGTRRGYRKFALEASDSRNGIFSISGYAQRGVWKFDSLRIMRTWLLGYRKTRVEKIRARITIPITDSLPLRIKVAQGRNYLGRWRISGFESLDSLVERHIARRRGEGLRGDFPVKGNDFEFNLIPGEFRLADLDILRSLYIMPADAFPDSSGPTGTPWSITIRGEAKVSDLEEKKAGNYADPIENIQLHFLNHSR